MQSRYTLFHLGRHSDARKYYDTSISINPNLPQALNGKGWVELRLGEFEKLGPSMKKQSEFNPRDSTALIGLAGVYADGFFQYEEAEKYAEKAIELDPSSDAAKITLAEVLLSIGKYTKSEKLAAEVLKESHRSTTYNFVVRFIITASLYLSKSNKEATRFGMDLLNYFKSLSYDHVIDWSSRG